MKNIFFAGAFALALCAGASGAYAGTGTFDFSQPVQTAPTDVSPGVTWFTDRYDPATFAAQQTYGGRNNTLLEATSVADGGNNRPAAFSSAFYNTQGRGQDYAAGTTASNIDLYIDPLYSSSDFADGRIAGFWGVGVDGTNSVTNYSIIELDKFDGALSFRTWDSSGSGAWDSVALNPITGSWATLSFALNGSNVDYRINGVNVGSVDSGGSTRYSQVILQTHNSADGVNDFAHFSGGVPEPASWALMILGFGGVGAMTRRRKTAFAAA